MCIRDSSCSIRHCVHCTRTKDFRSFVARSENFIYITENVYTEIWIFYWIEIIWFGLYLTLVRLLLDTSNVMFLLIIFQILFCHLCLSIWQNICAPYACPSLRGTFFRNRKCIFILNCEKLYNKAPSKVQLFLLYFYNFSSTSVTTH